MSTPLLTEQQVRERLQAACDLAGGQRRFAEAHGLRESVISETVNARRAPGQAVLTALGMREVRRFADLRNRNAAVAGGEA